MPFQLLRNKLKFVGGDILPFPQTWRWGTSWGDPACWIDSSFGLSPTCPPGSCEG